MRKAALFCLCLLIVGCDVTPKRGLLLPTRPSAPSASPAPPPVAVPPDPVAITIGEPISAVFYGPQMAFTFTAPTSGLLVARLTWSVDYNGTILSLRLGDKLYVGPAPWSPLVGTWSVTAGEKYEIFVGPGGTDWVYNDAFVLRLTIE